ncbi:protein FAM171A1 [Arapaima gigas]
MTGMMKERRRPRRRRRRSAGPPLLLLLCVLGCSVRRVESVSARPDGGHGSAEVTLKVHLSDSSTHQPIPGATVEIFANHTSFAAEISGADGTAFITFPYRVGTPLIVTATKPGYVPNSAPWRPARLPVFATLSLDLLLERPATLMVYEDVVHVVSGIPGSKVRPWVHFPRRALSLPPSTSYANLTALLTVASSAQEVEHFPYLQGLAENGTGSGRRVELTPIAAISVHLLGSDGSELQVTEPVNVIVPLSPNSGLKENDHVPAWRFDPRLGAWLKSGLACVQKEGDQLMLNYIAPQLGYWAAAMSPISTGAVVAKDISTYHTVFLLAILGGMGVILLFLACLLLYYCRRKCRRPRQHRKLQITSPIDSKRDQATSMSHVNLISEVHLELVSSPPEPDMHTPMLRPACTTASLSCQEMAPLNRGSPACRSPSSSSASLAKELHHSVEAFPVRVSHPQERDGYESPGRGNDRRSRGSSSSQRPPDSEEQPKHTSVTHLSASSTGSVLEAGPARPATPESELRPADYLLSRSVDHLERPSSLPRPGQLLCCSSVDQVTDGMYRRVRPTLVIPAHYMKLPGEHPYAGQPLLLQTEQQSDLETIQAELSASHQPLGPPGSESLQLSSSCEDPRDGSWTLQTTTMPESLSIPTSLSESGLVQMNGEDQLLAEKTLMELRGGKPLPHPRAWFVSLDGRSNAHIRHSYIDLQRAGRNSSNDASLDSGVDMSELARRIQKGLRETGIQQVERARSTMPAVSYTQLVYVDDADGSGSGSPDGSPEGQEQEEEEDDGDVVFRTDHAKPDLQLPSSGAGPDDSGEDENKKSPWQKREERPLLAFNLK